jgi:transposase
MIRLLEKEILAFDKAIGELVDADPAMKSRAAILESVKGIGKVTAWTILAYLTEMEKLSRNRLVALAGVAPFNRDSGKFSGDRRYRPERSYNSYQRKSPPTSSGLPRRSARRH